MKWPRGKHNGQRIVGLHFSIKFRVNTWYWRPRMPAYSNRLVWLCFVVCLEPVYD